MRYFFILLIIVNNLCFAQDTKQPASPKPPTEPEKPSLPGSSGNAPSYPGSASLPRLPSLPNINNQNNGSVYEIERYDLLVSDAFPQGNTRQNAANTIKNAQYVLFSNNTIQIQLDFTNGLQYVYHLRNSRSKMEIQPGVFRETYETIIQAGKEFLLEQYSSELYRNENSIISLTVIGNNKVVVVLNFNKK
jgi:hypothetical protein